MNCEIIVKVEILNMGELFLAINGSGNTNYQYVYREAAGVYWDENRKGFKSTPMKEWSCSKWFDHVVKTVFVGLVLKPARLNREDLNISLKCASLLVIIGYCE
jgi:hypothetical protein